MDKKNKERVALTREQKLMYTLRIALGAIIVLLLIYAVIKYVPDIFKLLESGDQEAMEAYVSGAGAKGVLIIVILQVLQTITIFFPGIPIYMCSGIIYGKIKGTIICYITYVASNVAIFIFSRRMKESADALLNNQDESKIQELMQKTGHPLYIITALCVIPLIPNGIIPHIGANSSVTLEQFIRAIAIGCIPGIFLFVVCGDLLMSEYFWLVIALMIIAILMLVFSLVFKKQVNAIMDKIMNKIAGSKK